jgi:pilus assembly protein Flp/PilA
VFCGEARLGDFTTSVRFLFLDQRGMTFMFTLLNRAIANFIQREDGPTAVEYAVMLALIIVVCIAAITALGSNANVTFSSVSNTVAGSGS